MAYWALLAAALELLLPGLGRVCPFAAAAFALQGCLTCFLLNLVARLALDRRLADRRDPETGEPLTEAMLTGIRGERRSTQNELEGLRLNHRSLQQQLASAREQHALAQQQHSHALEIQNTLVAAEQALPDNDEAGETLRDANIQQSGAEQDLRAAQAIYGRVLARQGLPDDARAPAPAPCGCATGSCALALAALA